MQDHLFTNDLMALRKRRANVGAELRWVTTRLAWKERKRAERLERQLRRTFYALTVIELRLIDKVAS